MEEGAIDDKAIICEAVYAVIPDAISGSVQ